MGQDAYHQIRSEVSRLVTFLETASCPLGVLERRSLQLRCFRDRKKLASSWPREEKMGNWQLFRTRIGHITNQYTNKYEEHYPTSLTPPPPHCAYVGHDHCNRLEAWKIAHSI